MSDRADFRDRLEGLCAELRADVEVLRPLAAAAGRAEDLDELLGDLDHQLERARQAAVVVLVGPTGAGKSTLLNALVGADVAREGVERPTTSRPVVYAPVDADLAELLDDLAGPPPQVVRYEPGGAEGWSEQVLVDAPDLNSVAREHRDTVRALAERADALLVVLHQQAVVEEATLSFLEDFAGRRELFFVLGFADRLAPAAREELLAQVRGEMRRRLGLEDPNALCLSAREARAGRGGEAFEGLVAHLEELARGGRLAGVKRHNALGVAVRLGELAGEIEAEVGAELERLGAEAAKGFRALGEKVGVELGMRAALRAPELADRLAAEAGRRWDGPLGWTLRAGALSTLGLGLAALVARRNPALAAGAALGGAVVGRLREGHLERRFEEAEVLLPEPSELEGWWREALIEVRLSAGRLAPGGELAPAEAAALGDSAREATEEAWRRLLARDLPEEAARVATPARRLAFDLWVWAFAGWLLWRAGLGFWTETYVGLDFTLNAVLLLAALLVLLRMIFRKGLKRRARGLLDGVASRAVEAVATRAAQVAGPLEERVRLYRDALARLVHAPERWRAELHGGGAVGSRRG